MSAMEVDGAPATAPLEVAPAPAPAPPAAAEAAPAEAQGAQDAASSQSASGEKVNFAVIFAKRKFDVAFPLDSSVSDLKAHLEPMTSVPRGMQKLMFKGMMKDGTTLREAGVNDGAKVMLVGSTVNDVVSLTAVPLTPAAGAGGSQDAVPETQPLSEQTEHKKVIEKGMPDDIMPGFQAKRERLPQTPLVGIVNKSGQRVRLTFKLEQDQLWISTKETTNKLPMSSITKVISEPIKRHEEYHIMALQLGTTEKSRYWLYWVPAQYVEAIKTAIGVYQS